MNIWNNEELVKVLKAGGVAVMPTDTIYGLVGSALNKDAVERIYELKGRDKSKAMIILVKDIGELRRFGISSTSEQEKILSFDFAQDLQPTSFILPCKSEELKYLHRGKESLAFRIPTQENLRTLLESTGPLVAPSANPESLDPATNIEQAKEYFDDQIDFYLNGGETKGEPSKIIDLTVDGKQTIVRA